MRTNKLRKEDGPLSQANLENVKNQTGRGMRLAEHTDTDLLSQTPISARSTDDVTRQNVRDKGKANRASIESVRRRNVVERGLLNHALEDVPS